MKKRFMVISTILMLMIITACNNDNEELEAADESLIYVTIYPIQYIIEQIAGDSFNVRSIFPPGVDAHTYEPTTKDMTKIAQSKAFFYFGSNMEGFAESAAKTLKNEHVKLIEVSAHEELFSQMNQAEEELHDHENEHQHDYDPHIWMDPQRMKVMAKVIKDELTALNPDEADYYQENYKKLSQVLVDLDEQYTQLLRTKKQKYFIVPHAAYGYWEERYGLKQIAISGVNSSEEPSQKYLTEVIQQAQKHQLSYVLFEQNMSDKTLSIIQEQIKARPLTIHNLSVLSEEDINRNEDYVSLMKYNLTILDQALR